MDTKAMIEKLNGIFCENNRSKNHYSKIWLADVDFGGLYENGMYVLNIQAEHEIESCKSEIRKVIALLNEKAKDELKYIWSVYVFNAANQVHCWEDGLIILDEQKQCVPSKK